MAGQSLKKTASANEKRLMQLHTISLAINILVMLSLLGLKRPSSYMKYIFFSIPGWICEYFIEKSGRPKYSVDSISGQRKALRSGDDLHQSGLLEYMFDIIYITWFLDILMILFGSNKVWWLFSIVPLFAFYKISELVKGFRGSSDTKKSDAKTEPEISKRQAKKEARKNKTVRVR